MNKDLLNLPVALAIGAVMLMSGPLMAQSLDKAAPEPLPESTQQNEVDDEGLVEQVKQRLAEKIPQFSSAEVSASTIPGLFEVIVDGMIYYSDESGEYLIDGSLIRVSDRTNMTDARLGKIQMKYIDELDDKDLLIYEPEVEPTGTLTVFTDISCGYCRRLHGELDTLLDAGVRVRYLLFPRAGLGSQGHKDLVSVWCAENPQEAMTNAKAGGKIEPATCENPVEMHVELARQLGLQGTPMMFTNRGDKIPGYRPAEALAELIIHGQPEPVVQ